jgi:hypothetical protein
LLLPPGAFGVFGLAMAFSRPCGKGVQVAVFRFMLGRLPLFAPWRGLGSRCRRRTLLLFDNRILFLCPPFECETQYPTRRWRQGHWTAPLK